VTNLAVQLVELAHTYLFCKSCADDAESLYRAALVLDPGDPVAHIGLADCAVARGSVDEAVDLLVEAAHRLAARPSIEAAYDLIDRAYNLDPTRLEIHIDIAEIQAKTGDLTGARHRLEQLASAYTDAGAYDEARDVLAAAEQWRPTVNAGEIEIVRDGVSESIPIDTSDIVVDSDAIAIDSAFDDPGAIRTKPPRSPTMVVPTLLRRPDGTLLPEHEQPPMHEPRRARKRTATGPHTPTRSPRRKRKRAARHPVVGQPAENLASRLRRLSRSQPE
jgi:tetratricopeptide (TPR) repeat protein